MSTQNLKPIKLIDRPANDQLAPLTDAELQQIGELALLG